MRLYSYARISRDDPPGVERLEIQHLGNLARIAELGAKCAGELEDDGISGYLDERWRPGLARLLESWRTGESQGAVARDSERYARNAALVGHLWILSRQASARMISRREDLEDRNTRNGAAQGGESYRESVRANCIAKFAIRAKEHLYPGGTPMFGTRWVRDCDEGEALHMRIRRQPVPYRRELVPAEVARLLRAIELFETGRSVNAAAAAIGIRQQRLLRVLRNPGLAGAHCYGRSRLIPDTPKRTTEGATPIIEWGAHEPIVPRERWEALQVRLDGITVGRHGRPGRSTVPLSGQLVCGVCGERVEIYCGPQPKKHRYRYCRCTSPARCVHAEVSRWPRPILAAVATHLADPETTAAIASAWARLQQPGNGRSTAEAVRLRRREATILDLAGDGTISADEARRRLAPIRAQAESLRSPVAHERGSARWLSPEELRVALLRAAAKLRGEAATDAELRMRLLWALKAVRITSARTADLHLAWDEILPLPLVSPDSSSR
jgi:DNA invertase Pin-like site-specific DNA recombinase